MSGGTVNISREIFEHGMFKDEPFTEREAWVWMIMEARWKPGTVRAGNFVVGLARGQCAHSVRFMAGAWGWTAAKVQRYIERLKKQEMISSKTDTGVSVITICNYDKFQNGTEAADTAPIQHRYSTDTEKKKDEIRVEDSEANASAVNGAHAEPEDDFAKQLFDRAVAFLGRNGTPYKQARAFVGKLRKDHNDTVILDAFTACNKAGVVDPIPWIVARLTPKAPVQKIRAMLPNMDNPQ